MAAHEDLTPKIRFAGPTDFSFGMVAAAAFLVAGTWPILRHQPPRLWALGLCGAFLLATLSKPGLLRPVKTVWMKAGELMNRIATPFIAGILFFGVITPLAWLFRMQKRDALRLRLDEPGMTYWIERRPAGPSPESMRQQF